MKTKQLAMDAMLAAMCAALGAVALDFGNLKVTLESLPVILGAALFGPLDGAVIGFVGTFIYQILRYGVSATTLLWMIPYCVCGLIVGWCAKRHDCGTLSPKTVLTVVAAEVAVTALNTAVLYIDSKIYGYYSAVFIFGSLVPRIVLCVGKAVAVGMVLPALVQSLRRFGFLDRRAA